MLPDPDPDVEGGMTQETIDAIRRSNTVWTEERMKAVKRSLVCDLRPWVGPLPKSSRPWFCPWFVTMDISRALGASTHPELTRQDLAHWTAENQHGLKRWFWVYWVFWWMWVAAALMWAAFIGVGIWAITIGYSLATPMGVWLIVFGSTAIAYQIAYAIALVADDSLVTFLCLCASRVGVFGWAVYGLYLVHGSGTVPDYYPRAIVLFDFWGMVAIMVFELYAYGLISPCVLRE